MENPQSIGQEDLRELPGRLNQQDLAKRLGVSYETVGKRDGRSDFAKWSREKDPNGIAWRCLGKEKGTVRVEMCYVPILADDEEEQQPGKQEEAA
jgi:hypothetical protein